MQTEHLTAAALDEAETRFQVALLANDIDVLDALIHEDAHFIGPDGVTIDKATDMAAHRDGALVLSVVEELERAVQMIDRIGVTRTTVHLVGTAGGQEVDAVLAYTRAWTASDRGWCIVAAHGGAGHAGR